MNGPKKPIPRTTTILNESTVDIIKGKLDIEDAIVTIKNYGIKKGLSKAMFDMLERD